MLLFINQHNLLKHTYIYHLVEFNVRYSQYLFKLDKFYIYVIYYMYVLCLRTNLD